MSLGFQQSEEYQERSNYEQERAFRDATFTITGEDVDRVIDKMNEADAMDKNAIENLTEKLHQCNEDFGENSIFFTYTKEEVNDWFVENGIHGVNLYAFSVMGFLNGILKELGVPRIAVMREENGDFIKFCLYTGE